MLLLLFVALMAFLSAVPCSIGQACPTTSSNLMSNGDFETLGSGCAIHSGVPLNAAFNSGCAPGWFAAHGTPSLCNANSAPVYQAFHGDIYACISSSNTYDPQYCHNEAFVQNLSHCLGDSYTLSFAYRWISGTDNGTLQVFLASNLTNVDGTNDGRPCLSDPGTWQHIGNVVVDKNQGWQQESFLVSVDNLSNNQLVFVLQPPDLPPNGRL